MGCTDPSGYCSIFGYKCSSVLKVVAAVAAVVVAPYAVAYFTGLSGFTAALVGRAIGGFTSSMIMTGGDVNASLKGAVIGGISAGVAYGVGSLFEGAQAANIANHVSSAELVGQTGLTVSQLAAKSALHAMTQGVIAGATGQNVRSAMIGGLIGGMVGGYVSGLNDVPLETAITAIAGGTVAALSGGKFANGAITAAMTYLFNGAAHKVSQNYQRFPGKINVLQYQ